MKAIKTWGRETKKREGKGKGKRKRERERERKEKGKGKGREGNKTPQKMEKDKILSFLYFDFLPPSP